MSNNRPTKARLKKITDPRIPNFWVRNYGATVGLLQVTHDQGNAYLKHRVEFELARIASENEELTADMVLASYLANNVEARRED